MDISPNPSPVLAKTTVLTPRSPVSHGGPSPIKQKKKKKSSLSSLEGQRFYLPGKSAPPDNPSKKKRSRNNLLTWQEFVMDGFGPTMSLASLVSWQDMLCYSPPPQGADGPSTPPEVRDALVAKKKKNTRQKLMKGISSLSPNKSKGSPRRREENSQSGQPPSPPKSAKKLWLVSLGKASTFSPVQGPNVSESSKKRLSIQPKAFGDWASRAKKLLHLKKPFLKKGKGTVMSSSPARGQGYRSSSSGSASPSPSRRLLAREDAPTKITVKRPSLRPDPISPVSSASVSTVSVAQPVSGWTFLAPPGQSSSPVSGLPAPPASLQPSVQLVSGGAIPPGELAPPMAPLLRHHSITANTSEFEQGAVNNLLEPRMSVADSVKSHETLWRRSVSSPSISSSYTSLSIPSGGSRQSSIWDYRGSIVSIPRGSIVSMGDAKRTLRANLTGNLTYDSRGREGALRKRVSDTPTHTHVHSMFCPSGHLAPFHVDPTTSDVPKPEAEPTPKTGPLETNPAPETHPALEINPALGTKPAPEAELEQQEPLTRRATFGGRKPSVVRKDHLEIYSHPYFEVAPNERHQSLSSLTSDSRSGHVQRRSTMDSVASFRTALDGAEDSMADVSFSSF
ncbi:hypothetical protein TWF481_011830 [Arthrobotrys musiformis]|uniref:Uncharacterized protein n=1 Tax=Arthrobotrys musiformis TaxID=47236 RepID=A0AAV9VWL7_9PEZI